MAGNLMVHMSLWFILMMLMQAGLIVHQGYIPQECHANQDFSSDFATFTCCVLSKLSSL